MITRTTLRLSISRGSLALAHVRAWLHQRDPLALVATFTLCLIIVASIARRLVLASPSPIAAQPTPPLPIIMIATARAEMPPRPTADVAKAAAVAPNTLGRAAVAYDSPNGSVIGAIEQGRAYTVLARYGADWLQLNVSGSGVVWLRSVDVTGLPADVADLAPAPAPAVVYVSAPAEGALAVATPEIYQVTNAPLPPSSNRTPAQEAERQQNIEARLANQYIYPTLAPMEENEVTKEWARQQEAAEHGQQPLTLDQMPCHCP